MTCTCTNTNTSISALYIVICVCSRDDVMSGSVLISSHASAYMVISGREPVGCFSSHL